MDRFADIIDATYANTDSPRVQRFARTIFNSSPLFSDAPWVEGSYRSRHEYPIRQGDSVSRYSDHYGRTWGFFQAKMEIAEQGGNPAKFLAMEWDGCAEVLAVTLAHRLFYGEPGIDQCHPQGLAGRYNTADRDKAQNAINVSSAGPGPGGSLWLLSWHPEYLAIRYPKNSEAGLLIRDLGEEVPSVTFERELERAASCYMEVSATLVVQDWRRVARIANVRPENEEMAINKVAFAIHHRVTDGPTAVIYSTAKLEDKFSRRLEALVGRPPRVIIGCSDNEAPLV